MPTYMFRCPKCKDEEGQPLTFALFLSTVPKKAKKDSECSECEGRAKRALDLEIPTQSVVGLTPISKSTTVKGSIYNTVKFAFGERDAKDPSQAPFRDSGELDKFMNGGNDLGKPKLDQRTGKPLRRQDGSIVREGLRFVKHDRGATPSRDDVRKRPAMKRARFRGGEVSFQNGAGGDIRITD